jgi:hypothetical protein
MRRLCRAAIALAIAALPASASGGLIPAAQAQARKPQSTSKLAVKPVATWTFKRLLGAPTLAYGIEAKDDYLITFSCQPDSGLLRVISSIGSRGLRPGDGAAIRLINGKAKFEVAGTAFSTEHSDTIDIGGATRFDASMLALFRQGDTLVVEVPGRKRNLTLSNAKAAADAFEKACAADARSSQG